MGNTQIRRCVSWIAVSSKPQYERESPETQRKLNADIARSLNGIVTAELIVPGESREYTSFEDAARELPAYRQLREIINGRSADLLIFRDIDRLGRTASLCLQVASECLKGGIALYDRTAPPTSLDSGVQATDQGSIILTAIRSSFSQIEMLKFRQRHQDGMIGRVQQGKFPGNLPYGYRKVFNADGSVRIEIVEEHARIIRLICWDLFYGKGWNYSEIARELNRRGHRSPTGKAWGAELASNVVGKAWRYAGIVELNKKSDRPYQRVRGDYPAIFTDEQAKKIDDEYQERRAHQKKSPNRPYLFSRVCVCAECGRYLAASTSERRRLLDGSVVVYRRYRCSHHRPNARITERHLIRRILAWIAIVSSVRDLEIEVRDESSIKLDEINARIEDAQKELDQMIERRNRLTRAYVDLAAINNDEYQSEMEILSKRKDAIEHEINALSDAASTYGNHAERVLRYQWTIENGKEMLESADISTANHWLRQNFIITVSGDGQTSIQFL